MDKRRQMGASPAHRVRVPETEREMDATFPVHDAFTDNSLRARMAVDPRAKIRAQQKVSPTTPKPAAQRQAAPKPQTNFDWLLRQRPFYV